MAELHVSEILTVNSENNLSPVEHMEFIFECVACHILENKEHYAKTISKKGIVGNLSVKIDADADFVTVKFDTESYVTKIKK